MACPRCAGSAVIFLLNPQPSTLPSPPPRCAGTAAISSAAISAPSRCTPHAGGGGLGGPSSTPRSSGETPLRGGRVIRPRGGDEGSAPPREERLRTSVHPHLRTSVPPHLRVWPSDRGTPPLVTFPLPSPFPRVWKSHRACPHHTCPPCDLLTHPHLCDPPPPPGPAPSTRAPPADARPLPPADCSSAARYALEGGGRGGEGCSAVCLWEEGRVWGQKVGSYPAARYAMGRRELGFRVRGRLPFRCADTPFFGIPPPSPPPGVP